MLVPPGEVLGHGVAVHDAGQRAGDGVEHQLIEKTLSIHCLYGIDALEQFFHRTIFYK
jgi:hypothetical protein